MDQTVRDYLAGIGRRGGRKSRRQLSREAARDMVRVREARRAFREFHTLCFWSFDPAYVVRSQDVPWVAEHLMTHGGRAGWERGARLCRLTPDVEPQIAQPGFIRATVRKDAQGTLIDWAHDSAWRFLPTVKHDTSGYQLHPIDLAINKLLALVGRREPRDLLDVLDVHQSVLPLGALVWAAAGKDPGFTPLSLLDLLRRQGAYQPEDFKRLHLTQPVDLPRLKSEWLQALADAEFFVRSRPPSEMGCLYYSTSEQRFVDPGSASAGDAVPHYGRPGGVLPALADADR